MELTSANVEAVLSDCLFPEGTTTPPPNTVFADGIMMKFGFDPDKLKLHRDDIVSMLSELPKEFFVDSGGGMSFLASAFNKKEEQWTSQHATAEALFALGLAIGKVREALPRQLWGLLPGGMPYYTVDLNAPDDPAPATEQACNDPACEVHGEAAVREALDAEQAEAAGALEASADDADGDDEAQLEAEEEAAENEGMICHDPEDPECRDDEASENRSPCGAFTMDEGDEDDTDPRS